MKSNGFQPLLLSLLRWSPVSAQLDTGPLPVVLPYQQMVAVRPGGNPPAASQPPSSLSSTPQHSEERRGAPKETYSSSPCGFFILYCLCVTIYFMPWMFTLHFLTFFLLCACCLWPGYSHLSNWTLVWHRWGWHIVSFATLQLLIVPHSLQICE